jgi:2,4-dienoyl-CoA reductase-like NADH-dependent reductase (Old Yellow Enzyme family)/thioredoxin reductase
MQTVFDSIKIGNVEIKNRMAVAPTVKNLAEQNGRVNARILGNYSIEADGPGLYIVSMTYTEESGRVFKGQTGMPDALSVFGMSEVANRIHKAGAKAFLQFSHGGNLCSEAIIDQLPVGPSDIPQWPGQTVHALTTEETEVIIDNFGKAAARAKEAGFDGMEHHACHGSLAMQFLSPIHNQNRTDRFSNPPQFLYECIKSVEKYCGKDFVQGVRLSCHEFRMEDVGLPGLEFDLVKEIVVELEKLGVAYIHASAGRIGHTPDHSFPPLYEPRGVNLRFAEEIKKLVNIPVITVGRFQDAKIIKQVIEEGKADMVAMCRPFIADPHIAKKIVDGKDDSIRKCMACNWCLERLFNQVGVECPMNPAYGWEDEYRLLPTTTPKRVMVVGGGVAGLQAAYAAATRGHFVSLYEKTDKLGGQVLVASQYPAVYTRELWNLPKWLIAEVNKLAVDIHMNTEVTEELIEKTNPDTIIVATGAVETKADIPISSNAKVVYLWDYLRGDAEVGEKVVIFGGEAVEAAASLGLEGKKVTMLQEGEDISWPSYIFPGGARREPLLRFLKKGKVDIRFHAAIKEIEDDKVTISVNGQEEKLDYDTVIVAIGRSRVDSLFNALKGKNREVYIIGDAKEPRELTPASHEGYWAGRVI